ncbi:uncharacterized protein [Cherax quadricarinatus]|uniref:uncharacterized protein isoform X2 n=1 Tax=Cherax quadricarinatus TaxID=27406 RepID=UPI00387E5933
MHVLAAVCPGASIPLLSNKAATDMYIEKSYKEHVSSEYLDQMEPYDYLQEMTTKSSSIRWPTLLFWSTIVTILLAIGIFLWNALRPTPGYKRYNGKQPKAAILLAAKLKKSGWSRWKAREYRKRVWINWKKSVGTQDLNTIARIRIEAPPDGYLVSRRRVT